MKKILRNAVQCPLCGQVIESRNTDGYVACACGHVAVTGGKDYIQRISDIKYKELSEYEEVEDKIYEEES